MSLVPAPLQPVPVTRVARHLKLTLTPEEHISLRDRYRTPSGVRFTPYNEDDEEDSPDVRKFWEALPEYVIARCPICGASNTERMDTHVLSNGWLIESGDSVYGGEYQYVGCGHFTGVQGFINLNGVVPTELSYYSSKSEVPYVMPIFLADKPISFVVMHSLPICRVEEGVFAPRYFLFMLTYYSEDPGVLHARRRKDAEKGRGDPDFRLPLMYTWSEAETNVEAWELPLWVARGKLWWLDLDRDDLPLKSRPVEEFPYGNIQGRRRPFIYRNGELIIPHYSP